MIFDCHHESCPIIYEYKWISYCNYGPYTKERIVMDNLTYRLQQLISWILKCQFSLWLGSIYVMLICSSFMLLLISIWKPGHEEFMFWRKKKNNGVRKIFHCWRVTTPLYILLTMRFSANMNIYNWGRKLIWEHTHGDLSIVIMSASTGGFK